MYIIGTVFAAFAVLVWALIRSAGMASRQEERWKNEQDHTNDT
jgi:hypothetical protein